MNFTHEDFQKAIRISNAVQDYFRINYNKTKVRSTDVYEYLIKHNLIEKDRHNGLHFKKFLDQLKSAGLLMQLVPQCKSEVTDGGKNQWYFIPISNEKLQAMRNKHAGKKAEILHLPEMKEERINLLLEVERPKIAILPKRENPEFTSQQIEIRKSHPRAYEYWSEKEVAIMRRFFLSTHNINKTAELLERQPHIVKEKLEELGTIPDAAIPNFTGRSERSDQ